MSRAGPLAAFGKATRKALVLWHEQLLARKDASQPAILLEFVDDESRPETAAERFVELARRIHIAVGPYGSQLTAAVMPVCREAGLPLLVPSAGDPNLDLRGPEGNPPIGFSLLPSNTESLTGAVDWAAARGIGDVALLFRAEPFSQQAAGGARGRARELGLHIQWDLTYSSAAEIWEIAFKHEGDRVGLLLGGGYVPGTEAAGFLPDAREIAIAFERIAEWKALLVAPTFPEFGEALGPRAEGILRNTNWKPWFPWPGNEAFVSAYRQRWGEEPDNHAAAAYAAGQLIEAAWKRVHVVGPMGRRGRRGPIGSTEPGCSEDDLLSARLALRRVLADLETVTVFGPFAVDGSGRQSAHSNILLQWRDGQLRPVDVPGFIHT